MHHGAALHVDASAIAANTRRIAATTSAEVMAVVKADGFGHGTTAALAALGAGATRLGVTSIEEALPLRWSGVAAPILSWLNPIDADYESAIRHDVQLAVASIAQLHAVAAAARRVGATAQVHLHLDTGLARDGADPAEWSPLCVLAREAEHLGRLRVVGIMSHLAQAESPESEVTRRQTLRFVNGIRTAHRRGLAPRHRHLAATAGTLASPSTHFDMVRIGAGLFGIDPSRTTPLRGAMTLTAPVAAVREVAGGTGVGYGLRYRTERRTRLALLPLGYADGIPRGLAPGAEVLLRGRRVRVAGTVSMDQLVLDVGDLGVTPGETATVFGPGDAGEPTLADWAGWAGTIEHELVTRIGARVARVASVPAAPAPHPRSPQAAPTGEDQLAGVAA